MPTLPLYSGNPFQLFKTPSTSPVAGAGLPSGPNVGLGDVAGIQSYLLNTQGNVNQARIPNAGALETQSSADIAALLNPPTMFPDVNRRAAEMGSARGISGSAAAMGTGLRLTDEERLKRIALGQQLLSGAYGRNPGAPVVDPTKYAITPEQQAQLNLEMQRIAASAAHGAGGGGFGGGYGGASPTVDLSGLLGGGGTFGGGGGFGSGGSLGDFNLDTALEELGLSGDLPSFDYPDANMEMPEVTGGDLYG